MARTEKASNGGPCPGNGTDRGMAVRRPTHRRRFVRKHLHGGRGESSGCPNQTPGPVPRTTGSGRERRSRRLRKGSVRSHSTYQESPTINDYLSSRKTNGVSGCPTRSGTCTAAHLQTTNIDSPLLVGNCTLLFWVPRLTQNLPPCYKWTWT